MRALPVALALGLLGAGPVSISARAATATASFSVSATVVSSCQASPMASSANGTIAATVTNAASAFAITCTLPTQYNVVAHTVTVTEVSASTRKAAGAGNDTLQTHSGDAHNANEQLLPQGTPPGTIIVTVSY